MSDRGSECTGEHTPRKQSDFEAIVAAHLRIVSAVMDKHTFVDGRYHYFDMNAGSGIVAGADGSPVIFAKQARELGMPVRGHLFEEVALSAQALAKNMADYQNECARFRVVVGDHEKTLPPILQEYDSKRLKCCGLMYFDPNGTIPPFDMIRSVSAVSALNQLDILINLAATTLKRARMAHPHHYKNLETILAGLGKKHVLVRTPMHRHQWTFLILTNWTDFPEMKRRGFYHLDSPAGREAMMKISLTAEEIQSVFTGKLEL